MGRGHYVCVAVDTLDSCVVDFNIMNSSRATERNSDKVKATSQVSRKEDRQPSRTKATHDSSAPAGHCPTTDQRDDGNILSCIIQEESHILRENLQRLLECSGLSDLPVTKPSLAWLPEPLRALTPCTPLLDGSAKSCDQSAEEPALSYARCFIEKPPPKDDKADAVRHKTRANKESACVPTDHEVVEVEVEWDDPSLRDVYPFLRQSYSTEQRALENRKADG